MRIRPVGGQLFHTDRLTDMTKLAVAFRNYANVPKKDITLSHNSTNILTY